MTIAVFNKGQFVDFWLNDHNELSWIERTIAAKAFLRQDVEVYMYELNRNGSEVLSFDENKNLQKIRVETVNVEQTVTNEDGTQSTTVKPVQSVVVEQTYNKIPLYLNGQSVNN